MLTPKNFSNHHGAIIQNSNNNRAMLDSMIKKQTINSGRNRGHMNSTTLRQDGNNNGRMMIKKAMSPVIDTNPRNMNVGYGSNPLVNSQVSQGSQ